MIRRCDSNDTQQIWEIINDGAQAYRGVIPSDCLRDPYMLKANLQREIEEGVRFWAYQNGGSLLAVMGLQSVQDVTLIRHAYVRSNNQKQGLGGHLLSRLCAMADGPILVGAWKDASWAIGFYEKFGFRSVPVQMKTFLLKKYWNVSDRQIEMSVVLANPEWFRSTADYQELSPLCK